MATATVTTWRMEDMPEGARAILAAVRIWRGRGTARGMAAMRDELRRARVPADALLPLFAVLGVMAVSGARAPRVAVPGTLAVGEEEMALLGALSAFQHGATAEGERAFGRWLPPVAARMVGAPAADLGRVLAANGVFLPMAMERARALVPLAAE